ncbi:hypothetical protein GCM10018791_06690 [Streptomyces zaomyceticus]|nr:hypothetical protein GCM10018791_06690 [Streptomyces zaomyceticus]
MSATAPRRTTVLLAVAAVVAARVMGMGSLPWLRNERERLRALSSVRSERARDRGHPSRLEGVTDGKSSQVPPVFNLLTQSFRRFYVSGVLRALSCGSPPLSPRIPSVPPLVATT